MTEIQTLTTLLVLSKDLFSQESNVYSDNQTEYFNQLLFNVADAQLIVGAKDKILRLSIYYLHLIERAEWPPSEHHANLCQIKGRSESACHNYVKILVSFGRKLFACGTNAFAPSCSWRNISSINQISSDLSGVALSPFDPESNVTARLSDTGEYYVGTPVDFTSTHSSITRNQGASAHNSSMLITALYDNWVIEPQFVTSFEDDIYVYFVFREIAIELINAGKAIYSRIARVCKNDAGGPIIMKENWSTLQKARLSCSVPGAVPFYYDEVQSAEYVPEKELLVATFSTPENGIPGSAICTYKMNDIRDVFNGPYKVQDSHLSTWEAKKSEEARNHFSCRKSTSPYPFAEYARYMLMYNTVQSTHNKPIYKLDLHRFTHLTVDVTRDYHGTELVLFVATAGNEVFKLVVTHHGVFLAEKWIIEKGIRVLTMKFIPETMSVYIGSTSFLARIPSTHCHLQLTESDCKLFYCGWQYERCVDNLEGTVGKLPNYNI